MDQMCKKIIFQVYRKHNVDDRVDLHFSYPIKLSE